MNIMNVLCLGARIVGEELARELVRAFLSAKLSGEERHRRRLNKVPAIESEGVFRPRPAGGAVPGPRMTEG